MSDRKETLKSRVLEYLQAQPGYNHEERENIHTDFVNNETVRVIYGKDEFAGVMGFGNDIDQAFADFVKSWKLMNGFEWIGKNK